MDIEKQEDKLSAIRKNLDNYYRLLGKKSIKDREYSNEEMLSDMFDMKQVRDKFPDDIFTLLSIISKQADETLLMRNLSIHFEEESNKKSEEIEHLRGALDRAMVQLDKYEMMLGESPC